MRSDTPKLTSDAVFKLELFAQTEHTLKPLRAFLRIAHR
jgi:hypothetical protein